MKPLSKSSWLYRINDQWGNTGFIRQSRNNSISLCTLIASTAQASVLLLIFCVLALVGVIGIVLIGLSLLSPIMLLTGYIPIGIVVLYPILIALLVMVIMVGFMLAGFGEMEVFPDYMKPKRLSSPNIKRYSIKDSYVYQYFKAIKDKVCPIIDIVD
ncbi:hypothetical protein S14_107 [Shewanella sp. phage 1/4]|uniref:hypothetical protein n=1 Tax=Shewanella phage 1/4 TaxID=1458859 RepID=UPI0004F62516|nr:hypothetical protein S14_107 [Shewanella sp. phage 1/4]AHK11216.1 hypothetical protein S14_107 [Shewanella sp. phage 1/4]